ncbi:non-ribosomal peptide synthetase [Pseudomonas sp. KNUC1026]|uniref:non-ribosomal peptide synthetase n=1 Tax=Pseudomonas sp. KNUC1026 TaxID=2893890 RepID=UPI001F42474F|nr:non-ribosomal peptide synthetase [Pseudomonas sp. KNUC1026]UFH49860.1 amino acid adenylation domain-containing protein [Pseudomonas sp. KNUC1026]
MSSTPVHTMDAGLPLSPEQQALLQRLPEAPSWADAAHALAFEVEGELSIERLEAALGRLLAGHQVLGSRFGSAVGYRGVRQFIEPGSRAVMLESGPQGSLQSWLAQPFEAQGAPLVRAAAWPVAAGQWRVYLAVASSLIDPASLAILQAALPEAWANEAEPDEEAAQFSQYLEWRAEVVLDEDAPQGKAYWQAHLKPAAGELLAPHPAYRRAPTDGETAVVEHSLADQGLDALAAQLGQPLPVLLQAAWWALLGRLSGSEQFLAGWRHDAREDYDYFETACGLFERQLPLLVALPAAESFAGWAQRLGQTLDEHRTWQEYCAADTPASPYSFACRAQASEPGHGWRAAQRLAPQRAGELHLSVTLGSGVHLRLEYAASAFSAAAAEALLEQYQALLGQLVSQAHQPLSTLSLLSGAERERHLAQGQGAALAGATALPARIAGWAARTPDALALDDGQKRLTYAELHAQALRVAGYLHNRQVRAGSLVALALPRSTDWVVAMLGAWYAGAGYLALDPQWPASRQALILEQAGPALVLGDQEAFAGLAELGIAIEPMDRALGAEPLAAAHEPALTDIAYVLFTSGSTGTPKGVLIEQAQLANYVEAASQALSLAEPRHFALGSTVAADLGHTALFGALGNGAALHIADDATFQDPQAFAAFIQAHGIDFLKIVPSHLSALLDGEQACVPQVLVLGGEAPSAPLLQRVRALRPHARVFNHYGPTETTVGVLVHALDSASSSAPLTQVLAGNRIYVLDAQQALVGTGELGELYIGGQQLCRGYLNAEADHAFIADPFNAGQRLYRTGDLARYRPEGGIQLAGRRDQQVKVRGYRIELAEIEQQLLALAGVSEAVVVAEPVQAGELELLAFVVGQGLEAERLASELQARLPSAMVPGHVQVLASMPRLANGKVDRRALLSALQRDAGEYVAPRTALETLLADRMAKLLGLERLNVEQDFFAAGGHSLLVIKLVAGIRKLLQCEAQPAIVFDHPSVAALAQALSAKESAPGQLEKVAQLRLRLDAMSPEEKAQLAAQARQQSSNPA